MFDLVIEDGLFIDPLNGKFSGSLGIEDGKIAELSAGSLNGKKVINADKNIVTPGFIDIHMHEDEYKNGDIEYEIFDYMAKMGVTTVVGGNCGLGMADNIDKYFEVINKKGAPVNYIGLMGHSILRESIGFGNKDRYRPASKSELKKMKEKVKKGLEKGASGLSFGLEYNPGTSTKEFLELSELVENYSSKIVSAHYRFDSTRSLEALAEMIIVARESGVKFQVSHIGSCTAFGQMTDGLEMLEKAYEAGVDVMADVYPYAAFSTHIGSAVFDKGCFERWNTSYDSIEMAEGKYRGRRCNKEIFEEVRENEPDSLAIAFVMNEKEVIEALQHPYVMVASDGLINNGEGHPRAAGAFPRVLSKYVREKEILDLNTALKKMTSMPAKRLGLESKGRIKEGYDADLNIINFNQIDDRATFANPTKSPAGIERVLIGGREVVKKGKRTNNLSGSVINL